MSILIEDVLDAWRQAERLLHGAPPGAERADLERAVAQLKAIYADLTATSEVTSRKLARATAVVERSRRVLEEANARLGGGA